MYAIELLTPATTQPLELDQAKSQLRLSTSDDDLRLADVLIPAVAQHAQLRTGRQLHPATWRLHVDSFPAYGCPIYVPFAPLRDVTGFEYTDQNGATQQVPAATYEVDSASEPGEIRLAHGAAWPTVRIARGAVRVTLEAGYDVGAVPEGIVQGMLLKLEAMYDSRDDLAVAADNTLDQYAVGDVFHQFGALRR